MPLSGPARQLLSEIYARQTGKGLTLGQYVFPGAGGTGHVVELKRAWRRLTKAAEITGLRIHDLRHSFASQLVSGGASLPLVGALLGHSKPGHDASLRAPVRRPPARCHRARRQRHRRRREAGCARFGRPAQARGRVVSQKHARERSTPRSRLSWNPERREEARSERVKDYERRLNDAEAEARLERLEHLSDADIKALLERQERDEREGVTRTWLDDLRDLGVVEPDVYFMLKRVEGFHDLQKQQLARRDAVVALLDTDIPLSRRTRQFLKGELISKWWPNKQRQKRENRRSTAEIIRAELKAAIAEKRNGASARQKRQKKK